MSYDFLDVPVTGGDLHVGQWHHDATGPPVLALHGVTGNHLAWSCVADHTPFRLIAPDLRGRGRSADLTGPAGMSAHADDLLAVVDHLGLDRVIVVGHSMGGFAATAFAQQHPDRVAAVLLADGGLPLPAPPSQLSAEEVIAATIGPAAERLAMTFADTAAYLDYWRAHPALTTAWSPLFEEYFEYDLVGTPPYCRSSVSSQAVGEDSVDLMDTAAVVRRAEALPAGTVFLRAPNGMLGDPGGLYPEELARRHQEAWPALRQRLVEATNHYTLVMAGPGAKTIAGVLSELADETVMR